MALTTRRPARTSGRATAFDAAWIALLAYVPFFLSSPGKLTSDTKQYLYLDPGRYLSEAAYLWNTQLGAGTVPHQQIGYLFPMGPYYWLTSTLGVPDWIAQRLWLGTISFLAALGVRWLLLRLGTGRVGACAGALVYMLTPYQLAFTARISAILLPWAALPWLVGLTMRAVRRGGWRDPALIALILMTAGSVNASALLLVCVAPAIWLIMELVRGWDAAKRAVGATLRIALLGVGASLWWIEGLRVQGAYGLPVLQLTENVQTVSVSSSPGDLLRGLGNWFFYGRDQLGYSLDQASWYVSNHLVIVITYAVPALALVAAALTRWRHRTYFGLLIVVGTVIGVGAWPFAHPSAYGRAWNWFATNSAVGLAFRNSARIVPIIVLGIAALLAAAVASMRDRRIRLLAGGVVAAVALAALYPVWRTGYLSTSVLRPASIPTYWDQAASAMSRDGNSTRVLEIPGADFAAYTWGNTIDPVTPGLTSRGYLSREVLPFGSPQSVNLLDAFDRRIQLGVFEPSSLAPIARLFGAGTVSLRSDLQPTRFDTPDPNALWRQLTQPLAPGVGPPRTFGPTTNPPPVALFPVLRPVPIVHATPTTGPVVVSGDGDGVVDSAAAGLLDGREQLFEQASLGNAQLTRELAGGADLVMTDSNRRRIQSWFSSIRNTKGPTERAGETFKDPAGYDYRLRLFPHETDDDRTVVEQVGGQVSAAGGGGSARPEDRAVYAFDGDTRTSWRVGGANPAGQKIHLHLAKPVTVDHVTLVQPLDGPRDRVLTKVRLTFERGAPVDVDLGPSSLTKAGQVVHFSRRSVRDLTVELRATTKPPFDPANANAVGFAEIGIDHVHVYEVVRLPLDTARDIGTRASGHSLAVVLSRVRQDPAAVGRQDDELDLDRRFVLPDARTFGFTGTARLNPNAPAAARASAPSLIGAGCRSDLMTLDGKPFPVRITGTPAQARSGLTLVSCDGTVSLSKGSHTLLTRRGLDTGIDIDRVVLTSDTAGKASAVRPLGAQIGRSSARLTVESSHPTSARVSATTDGKPFWFVFGQSENSGWHAKVDGKDLGPPTTVEGYANGWLVTPQRAGKITISLSWTPQRSVWIAIGISIAFVLLCMGILVFAALRRRPGLAIADAPIAVRFWEDWQTRGARWPAAIGLAVAAGTVAGVFSRPWIGVATFAATLVALELARTRWVLTLGAPIILAVSRVARRPELGWLALALFATDLLVSAWRRHAERDDLDESVVRDRPSGGGTE
ncbi:MAG TPA: alpha-(1-_3)-arabinofuranosyltransferase family protein [Acidimicrobiia bacterium]|jgi:arabinofuranan 3-O-arabinosyltransferase